VTINTFILQVGAALLMGLLIGLERQFGRHPAGLRTNALVCVGAALFVMLSRLFEHSDSPTRIAAQVVSGIGFLGGGVILREGMTVKGMTTAATLWCSAAIGTLAGAGYVLESAIGTAFILVTNLVLHPVSQWIDARLGPKTDVETNYRLKIICRSTEEILVRSILTQQIHAHPQMVIQGVSIHATDDPSKALIVGEVCSNIHDERAMQDVLSRLNSEPSTSSVSWERLP
jgi:putative Mg2+ transporter-C (MgtC) family protein